jgi:hypothetical protein
MQLICRDATKAARRYSQRMGAIGVLYIAIVWEITKYVQERHPTGPKLFLLAATPALDVVAMIAVVGVYLREEVDEYKRYQLVIAILCAIGVTLAYEAFVDFLRSYGAIGAPPPFTEFMIFWFTLAIAQLVQKFLNRVKADE